MSEFNWGNYAWAYKAIHDKLDEILAKLDNPVDPQLVNAEAILKEGISVLNRGQISNGDFEKYIYSAGKHIAIDWFDASNIHRSSGTNPWSGFRCLTLKRGIGAFNGIYQSISPSIPADNITSFAIMHRNNGWDDGDFNVQLFYADGTSSTQVVTAPADWAWHKQDITYDANKFIIGIRIYTTDAEFTDFEVLFLDALSLNYPAEVIASRASLLAGQQTVASAGTPVALGSGPILHSVLIQPMPTNTGNVFVGNSSGQHFVLTPTSEPIRVFAKDLGAIYIDAANNGEGVNYLGG